MFGLLGGGGSASSSQTLGNSVNLNPVFNIGDNNEASTKSSQSSDLTSSAENKDELALSAGVAVGDGASAQGGAIARSGDIQPMGVRRITKSFFDNKILVFGGVGVLFIGGILYFKRKKKGK